MVLGLLIAAALPFVVSPGASFTITVGAAMEGDRAAPIRVWAGTALGIALIAAVAGATGLGSIVASSDLAQLLFGVAGGIVLIIIGTMTLVQAFRMEPSAPDDAPTSAVRLVAWSFLAVVSNVKALSLYVVIVPALGTTDLNGPLLYAEFAVVHIAMLLVWLVLVAAVVRAVPAFGSSGRARAVLLIITALALGSLGLRSLFGALS